MKVKSAVDYCLSVKEDDVLLKKQMFKIPVEDNCSPLVKLTDQESKFIFEPSFFEGYEYMVRTEIAEKLDRINQVFLKQNKVLVIRSVWRSHAHQKALLNHRYQSMRKQHPEKSSAQISAMISHFIAPESRSMHATGGSVDALIHDLETGEILDFGTNEGYSIDLGIQCYPYHPEISVLAQSNRQLLIHEFEKEDFVVDLKEFWHFDYGNVAWAAAKNHDTAIYGPIFN